LTRSADVPEGFIRSEEELRALISGRVAVGPIANNQILTSNMWTELTVDITPLAEQIPSGKQALTVSTDQVRGVNGFIQPGDRINAILTLDIEFELLPGEGPGFGIPEGDEDTEGEEEKRTPRPSPSPATSSRGFPVLAVGRDVRPQEGARQEVTVTPEGEAARKASPRFPPRSSHSRSILTKPSVSSTLLRTVRCG
jgi:Flp pilus assembly protein CpaB